jgi:curli biogenesis system outer membrane secretion channel CsgG
MRKSTIGVIAGVLFACWSYAAIAQVSQGEKDTVLIGELKVKDSVKAVSKKAGTELSLERVNESLDAQLISTLSATRVFQIVERKRKGDLELEQAFAAVAVDANDKNAAQALKMAGAKYAFLPQIDGFEDRTETVEFTQIGRTSMNRRLDLSAIVQIIDTTTGKMLPDAPSVQLSKSEVIDMARAGQATGSDRVLVELAREMASRLSQGCVNLLRPAKVLALTGKQILINRGSDAGFSVGDTVEVYASEEIKDEDTGESYRNEVPVGKATIVRGDPKQSFAMLAGEDLGIAKGCVVKVVQSAASVVPDSAAGETNEPTSPGSSEKPFKVDR